MCFHLLAPPVRQVMPGVILMPVEKVEGYAVQGALLPNRKNVVGNHSPETISAVARELLKACKHCNDSFPVSFFFNELWIIYAIFAGFSPTAEAIRQRSCPGTVMRPLNRATDMLHYMGDVLCFSVQFTDFPQVG